MLEVTAEPFKALLLSIPSLRGSNLGGGRVTGGRF
jgi:hypothetical protein